MESDRVPSPHRPAACDRVIAVAAHLNLADHLRIVQELLEYVAAEGQRLTTPDPVGARRDMRQPGAIVGMDARSEQRYEPAARWEELGVAPVLEAACDLDVVLEQDERLRRSGLCS